MTTEGREKYLKKLGLDDATFLKREKEQQQQDNTSEPTPGQMEEAKKTAKEARRAALEKAHTIRMFEIRMLWQRALFVWGFQFAIFVASGSLIVAFYENSSGENHKTYILYGLCALTILGVLISYALILINKGSKFWQENWEYHIDMLEEEFHGHLHQTLLNDKDPSVHQHYSVSKVNKGIAWIFFMFWLAAFGICILLIFRDSSLPIITGLLADIILFLALPALLGTVFLFHHCTIGKSGNKFTIHDKQRETIFENPD